MAITCGFFNSVGTDRQYDADQMSEYFDGLVSNGVYESVGGGLQVTAGTGLSVNVASGRAIVQSKWVKNDGAYNITLTAANALLNRYTAIIIKFDLENRVVSITSKDGTAATSPSYPELTQNTTVFEYALAYVYVAAGATAITQANITDNRGSATCPWITGIVDQVDTSTLFAQYQTAYQEMIASMQDWQVLQRQAFDSWFADLTQNLQVNTYIQKYEKTVTNTTSGSQTIALDMTGYTFDAADVFLVSINGLAAVQNTDYTVTSSGVTVNLQVNGSTPNTIDIVVLKSKIGDPSMSGGAITINNTSTISGSAEVNS